MPTRTTGRIAITALCIGALLLVSMTAMWGCGDKGDKGDEGTPQVQKPTPTPPAPTSKPAKKRPGVLFRLGKKLTDGE